MAEDGYPVKLHIYDLSQGMARQLSSTILGKAIEGIWHTGVVVYGREYYFGGGIQKGEPGLTPYGTPVRVADLGVTHVPREVFEDFLREIGPRYTPATYDLLSHNCNNFSNEAAQFLAGVAVPSYILELPKEVMNSPLGALILPMIQGLETSLRAGAVPQPPQLRPAPAPAPTATAAQPQPQPQPQPSAIDVETRSTAADEPEAGKTEVDVNGNGSTVVPPAVQPAAPPAAAAQVSAATKAAPGAEVTETADDKPEAGKTAGNDSTVAPTAVQPAAPPAAAAKVSAAPAAAATKAAPDAEGRATAGDKPEAGKTASNDSTVDPPAVQPAAPPAPEAAAEASAAPAVAAAKAAHPDPLAEAKRRVQEEITREFAAIMASGAARAGEAAALATRRVMERHGLQRAAVAAQRA